MYGLTISVVTGVVDAVAGEIAKGTQYHNGLVVWVYAGAINVLVFVLWWVIKGWVGNIDTWRSDAAKSGGFVTREQYFDWCRPQQQKCKEGIVCRLEDVEKWRDTIMDKGGALSFQEHLAACERVGEKTGSALAKRLDEFMFHHREWVESQLQLMSERLEKRLLEGFSQLRKEVEQDRKAGSNVGK